MLFFSKVSRSFPEPTKSSHVPSSFAVAFLARIWQVWLEVSISNLPSCDLKYFMLFVLTIVCVFNMILLKCKKSPPIHVNTCICLREFWHWNTSVRVQILASGLLLDLEAAKHKTLHSCLHHFTMIMKENTLLRPKGIA